jgi:hypothetical protein
MPNVVATCLRLLLVAVAALMTSACTFELALILR